MAALHGADGAVCDDCMAAAACYSRRQAARAAGRKLAVCGSIWRGHSVCAVCGKTKTVSSLLPFPDQPVTPTFCADPAKPWTWEGNVQSQIAEHLAGHGFALLQVVDTASKAAGVDVIAVKDGRELWITVKGYPEGKGKTSPSTQCWHWFAHAMWDVARYRDERPDIAIGVGLPDGLATYLTMARKAEWLRTTAPFAFFWVEEDGTVRKRDDPTSSPARVKLLTRPGVVRPNLIQR